MDILKDQWEENVICLQPRSVGWRHTKLSIDNNYDDDGLKVTGYDTSQFNENTLNTRYKLEKALNLCQAAILKFVDRHISCR